MTKDVLITISGIQTIDGEVNDPIETVTPGEYYFRNGKHYILYDEVQEGVPGVTKCMIKIGEDAVDLSKKGNAGGHMSFQKDKKTRTSYQTPYGSRRGTSGGMHTDYESQIQRNERNRGE